MMDAIMEHMTVFFDIYQKAAILIYTAVTSWLLIYWLRPFLFHKKAAYAVGFIYLAFNVPAVLTEDDHGVGRILSILFMAIAVVILWLLDEKRNPVQKTFLVIIFRLINWITIEIFSEFGHYEGDMVFSFDLFRNSVTAAVLEYIIWNLLFYSGACLLLFAGIKVLHRTYRTKSEELSRQEFIMLIIPACSLLAVKPIMRSYVYLWMDGIRNGSIKENIHGDPYRILFDVLSYLSILIIIAMYEKNKDRQKEIFARKALLDQTEDMKHYVGRIEELYEKMRSMRHDMGNHMTVISGLAAKGDTDEIAEYTRQWQSSYFDIQSGVKTGNGVTDVVLSDFAERTCAEGVSFEHSFIYPVGLEINPFDMSVVLTNALQNAIESAKKTESPHILLSSVRRDNVFILSVKNTEPEKVRPGEDGLPHTTKEGTGHGYGLKNIQSIARKYNGDIEILQEHTDGKLWFILNVMFMGV